jgi:hypothetical protein
MGTYGQRFSSVGVITSNYDVAIEKPWGFKREDMHEVDDLSLRTADDWIIIGYSFPDEDLNIWSLFTRALARAKNGLM